MAVREALVQMSRFLSAPALCVLSSGKGQAISGLLWACLCPFLFFWPLWTHEPEAREDRVWKCYRGCRTLVEQLGKCQNSPASSDHVMRGVSRRHAPLSFNFKHHGGLGHKILRGAKGGIWRNELCQLHGFFTGTTGPQLLEEPLPTQNKGCLPASER